MTAHVLRERVDDHVRGEVDELEQRRRGNRVVGDEDDAVTMGHLGNSFDVDDVARRLPMDSR